MKPALDTKTLVVAKEKTLSANTRIVLAAQELEVTDEESYLLADALLGQIQNARKAWGVVWKRLYDDVVKPMREALDGAYAVNRDADKPLEEAETAVKAQMKAYKKRELEENRRKEEQRVLEAKRLQDAIDAKERAAAAAKTPAQRRNLEAQVANLQEEQADIILDVPVAVQGQSSFVRVSKVPVITDLAEFATGVIAGGVELDAPMQAALSLWVKREYKKDPTAVASWPGITMEDDPSIVRK